MDLISVAEVPDADNPFVRRYIRVDGWKTIHLSFLVSDRDDGLHDSALIIKDMYFSELEMPGTSRVLERLPSEDVKLSVGSYRFQKNLMYVPGNGIPFDFTLYYNARQTWTSTFARKWSHSYAWSLHELGDGVVQIRGGDGGSLYFSPNGENINATDASSFLTSWKGVSGSISKQGDGTFIYTDRDQATYRFRSNGLLSSLSDINGNTLIFTYDAEDHLISIEDTRGGNAALTYSTGDNRRLLSVIYEGQMETHFTYTTTTDNAGNVINDLSSITGPSGEQTEFTYDDKGNLLTGLDADGVLFIDNGYSGETLISQTAGSGAVDRYAYLKEAMEHTNRLGQINFYTYDIRDRITSKTTPANHLWRYFYDDFGNLTREIDPLGNETLATYDDQGNPVSRTDPLGNTTSMTYDIRNNLLTLTDPSDSTTAYDYDLQNRLLEEIDPLNFSVLYDYNAAGQVTRVTDRKGNQMQYAYSAAGDLTEEIDPLGHRVQYAFDSLGRMTALTDENGHSTGYLYNPDGRLLCLTDPLGHETSYTYNARGQKLSVAKSNGAVNHYAYNINGDMISVTDPLGHVFFSAYDDMGQLIRQTDPLGRETSYAYDFSGRMQEVQDALGGTFTISYDAVGNRTRITDANGNSTHYAYDALGRITKETSALGHETENTYGQNGLLKTVTNARGSLSSFYYDAANQLVLDRSDRTVRNDYDANGNPIESIGVEGTITRAYDALDRLVSRTDTFGNTIGYAYDPAGNLAQIIYSDGKTVDYSFDERNRLVKVVDWEGNTTVYTYDSGGNLLSIARPNGTILFNEYDRARQLVAVSDKNRNGETIFNADFAYDAVGIRTSAKLILPLDPQLEAVSNHFSYDADNQISSMNSQSFAYDHDGNMIHGMVGAAMADLEYDHQNRLTKVGGHAYAYDAEGLRIRAEGDGKTRRYVQDTNAPHSRLLEEHDENGNIIARYVYGIGVISRSDDTGNLAVYHFNSTGSTIALTDDQGRIKDAYAYGPYGKPAGRTGTTENPFTFIGRDGVVTDDSGLYFMRARYYEPQLMRFIQKDHVFSGNLMAPQSLNRHAYVKGNPIQFIDPSGEVCPCAAVAIGAAVGVGTNIAIDWATGDFNPLEDNWGVYLENNWLELSFAAVTGAVGGNVVQKGFKLIKHAKRMKKIKDFYRKQGVSDDVMKIHDKVIREIKSLNLRVGVVAVSTALDAAWDGIQSFGQEIILDNLQKTAAYQAVEDWTVRAAKDVGGAIEGVWSSAKKTVSKLKFW